MHLNPKELLKERVAAFNRTDADALAAFYSDNAINHQIPRDSVQGRAAIRRMFIDEFAAANMVSDGRSSIVKR